MISGVRASSSTVRNASSVAIGLPLAGESVVIDMTVIAQQKARCIASKMWTGSYRVCTLRRALDLFPGQPREALHETADTCAAGAVDSRPAIDCGRRRCVVRRAVGREWRR